MNYLLDTNAVVALLRNKPATVRHRYRQAQASGDYVALSSVVLFELWYGVAKSSQVPYELLIAGQALRRGPTVVTANTSELSRVTGLNWQDWTS